MTKPRFSYRILNLILACVQNMTMGGILFGWASISGSLLVADPDQGGPGLSAQYINIVFVVAAFFSYLGPLLLGAILDYYGPRICSIVSILFVITGLCLFGVSDRVVFPMFIPAMSMVAFGGPGVQNAIIHLGNLFPGWKATATAVITGSFQLSFVVFFIFDQLFVFANWSFRQLFLSYCLVCALNIIISLTFWPDIPYHHEDKGPVPVNDPEDPEGVEDHFSVGLIRLPSLLIKRTYSMLRSQSFEEMNALHEAKTAMHRLSLKEQLFSEAFIKLTLFFIAATFWANFYVGTMDIQLGDSNMYNDIARQNYDRIFTLVMTGGFLAIPAAGLMMDHLGFPLTATFISFSGLMWSICLMTNSETSLVASFVFYSLFRTFLFAFIFAYSADTMGFKYYGILVGIMFVIGGFFSLLQFPLASWATGTCHQSTDDTQPCDKGQWNTINLCVVFTMAISFAFAFEDWRRRRQIIRRVTSSRMNLTQIGSSSMKQAYGAI